MTIDITVRDYSNKNRLAITDEGTIGVYVHPHPPINEKGVLPRPFSQYFINSSASSDMRVNGATTNVDFYISAIPDFDIYLKVITVVIADTGAQLNLFGALTALTNGVEFIHQTTDLGTTIINSGIKTNQQFIRQAMGKPAFGTGVDAFKADLSGIGADAYLPTIYMDEIFGMPYGLRLRKDSTDRLIFKIRDDLSTGIDQFDAIAYGIKL